MDNNSRQETKFQCDPVSLIFLSSILVAILVLQILIEIKKRKLRRMAEKAEMLIFLSDRNNIFLNSMLAGNTSLR
jgi:hypothetical protein